MASSSTPLECGICLENYDLQRRPKVLPCGHNFCNSCLQSCISLGGNKCSICRRTFRAASVDEIPTNNDLEKIIEMFAALAVKSSKTVEPNEIEDDFSKGRCPKHRRSFLYFKCKTHYVDVCHECTVLEHSPTKCSIIDLRAEVMKNKENRISEAERNLECISTSITTLETIFKEKNKKIFEIESQIESLNKEKKGIRKIRDQTRKDIINNKNMASELQGNIAGLKESVTKKKIRGDSLRIEKYCRKTEKHLAELEEKYISEIILKDPKRAAEILTETNLTVYAVEVDGPNIIRSSKVLPLPGKNGYRLSSLEDNVRPTPDAIMIPMSSLLLAVNEEPVVYLELGLGCEDMKFLGEIRIRLTCGPRRQAQMLQLCTGQQGFTWKGECFLYAWGVGKPGEIIQSTSYDSVDNDNYRDIPLVYHLEKQKLYRFGEGAVTGVVDGARFMICTRGHPTNSSFGIKLGKVESGLDMLRDAISEYNVKKYKSLRYNSVADIRFLEAGVEITTEEGASAALDVID